MCYGYAFRRIPLIQGKYAIVDPENYDGEAKHKWHIARGYGTFYAVRNTGRHRGGKRIVLKMHREILKDPASMFVDHIHHNGMDNRNANLRPASPCRKIWPHSKAQQETVDINL